MRLIIAGGRDYVLTGADHARLGDIDGVSEVVSGGAKGADLSGEQWANSRGIPIVRFNADWNNFGRGAGPERNRQMAKYANAVALFPGGKGTESMASIAKKGG